jgi:hypothetical protein
LIKNYPVNKITSDACRIFLVKNIGFKVLPASVQPVQASTTGCNPDVSRFVFGYACDKIIADAVLIPLIVFKKPELISIIPVEPAVRSDPNKAFALLENTVDVIITQPAFG